jgi:hypothetical protein
MIKIVTIKIASHKTRIFAEKLRKIAVCSVQSTTLTIGSFPRSRRRLFRIFRPGDPSWRPVPFRGAFDGQHPTGRPSALGRSCPFLPRATVPPTRVAARALRRQRSQIDVAALLTYTLANTCEQ